MRGTHPTVNVPPVARARALGALVPPGTHAVAYATAQAEGDSLLAGHVLEGLRAGERVLVLAEGTRSVAARLRAQGVGPGSARPGAFRLLDPTRIGGPLAEFAGRQAAEAVSAGYEGARVVQVASPARARQCLREEAQLPARFSVPLTVLCIYHEAALRGVDHATAWAAAKHHGRIVLL